jgi:hypothetical protein
MAESDVSRLEKVLLLHLLEHRGQQVRFEASQWTTEFGIFRRFGEEDQALLKATLRSLETTRMIYLRTQYVVGFSEPKHVYSLTPTGHRKALEYQQRELGSEDSTAPADAARPSEPADGSRRTGGGRRAKSAN